MSSTSFFLSILASIKTICTDTDFLKSENEFYELIVVYTV